MHQLSEVITFKCSDDKNEQVTLDKSKKLGEGGFGQVFEGVLQTGVSVAVKIIDTDRLDNAKVLLEREEESMKKLNHVNVLKFFGLGSKGSKRYFVLELCEATLCQYVKGEYKGPMPNEREALMQMTEGLIHIHQNKFVHRDLKPNNILIKVTSDKTVAVLKISDFGLCKPTTESGNYSMGSGVRGTKHYISPELMQFVNENANEASVVQKRGNISSDIFALGCLFYYFSTKGKHPYIDEDSSYLVLNALEGKHFIQKELASDHFAYKVIEGMILPDPSKRWKLDQVMRLLRD